MTKAASPFQEKTLTQESLRSMLLYDPETGIFTWRACRTSLVAAGSVAGSMDTKGYVKISIAPRVYAAHRLAFLYMLGRWPHDQVDHADKNKSNNRWANLRDATQSQNVGNQSLRKSNSSGFKGVYWHKRDRNWQAQIMLAGRSKSLGAFDCPAAAHFSYVVAAQSKYGEFARFS